MKDQKVLDALVEAGVMQGMLITERDQWQEAASEAVDAMTSATELAQDLDADRKRLQGRIKINEGIMDTQTRIIGDFFRRSQEVRTTVRALLYGTDAATEMAMVRLRELYPLSTDGASAKSPVGEPTNEDLEAQGLPPKPTPKPYKGRIRNWHKVPVKHGSTIILNGEDKSDVMPAYFITGLFVDHENFKGRHGHTSTVVSHDWDTGEVETLNSRYQLEGVERR